MHLVLACSGAAVEIGPIRAGISDCSDRQHPDETADVAVASARQPRVGTLILTALDIGWAPTEVSHEVFGRREAAYVASLSDEGGQADGRADGEVTRGESECAELPLDRLLDLDDLGVEGQHLAGERLHFDRQGGLSTVQGDACPCSCDQSLNTALAEMRVTGCTHQVQQLTAICACDGSRGRLGQQEREHGRLAK